jgi:flagellar biogenesis protein FliO
VVREAAAVVFVLGLLLAALWLLRRGGLGPAGFALRAAPTRGGRELEKLERLPLTPQHALHRVRFGKRTLIVATHPQGCSVLAETAGESQGAGA